MNSKVSILGSCTVINYPEDIDLFFHGEVLVDVRNGYPMEMDSLPLLMLATNSQDYKLKERIARGIMKNLEKSGGFLWKCGVWGNEEVHLRFTSTALRAIFIFPELFPAGMGHKLLLNHVSHHDNGLNGTWFLHDSIETEKLPFYQSWSGVQFQNASANNMLILNTHLDTLITLLVASQKLPNGKEFHKWIQDGLLALETYYDETSVVSGIYAKVDSAFRAGMAFCYGRKNIFCRGFSYIAIRVYYRRVRMLVKSKIKVRGFSDGFLERDVRLTGPSLEYHVVNIWDSARLLLWLEYASIDVGPLKQKLLDSITNGLKYCFNSKCYSSYMKRLSAEKGVSNEVLESIAILVAMGGRESWLVNLYLGYRKFSPPSVGIMGLDYSLSGLDKNSDIIQRINNIEGMDVIPFSNGKIFVANHSENCIELAENELCISWSKALMDDGLRTEKLLIKPNSVAVLNLGDIK